RSCSLEGTNACTPKPVLIKEGYLEVIICSNSCLLEIFTTFASRAQRRSHLRTV
ncbi:hypothetical protein MKX01_040179, partial [Papaver californicum]